MKPRTALVAAIVFGATAVALVAVDLAFNVEAHLEAKMSDGTWQTVAKTGSQDPYVRAPACGNDFRLVVHNSLPWSTTQLVTIQPNGISQAGDMRQTWTLGAGETRTWEFHLNGTASSNGVEPKGFNYVQVNVGNDLWLSGSVCTEATP